MIKIKIKSKLKESGLSTSEYGLAVYEQANIYNLMFLNMDNFQLYVDTNRPPDDPSGLLETLPNINKNGNLNIFERKTPIVIGFIALEDTLEDGMCFDALKVKLSSIHESYAGRGLGTHFYKIALAYAASIGKPAIRPDTGGPTDHAQRVWQSLDRDPRINKNFDRNGNPTSEPADPEDEYLGDDEQSDPDVMDYFDFSFPKKTVPEIDDCDPNKKSKTKNFLNRAYSSRTKMSEFNTMNELADNFISDHFENYEEVYKHLSYIGHKLFSRRYNP